MPQSELSCALSSSAAPIWRVTLASGGAGEERRLAQVLEAIGLRCSPASLVLLQVPRAATDGLPDEDRAGLIDGWCIGARGLLIESSDVKLARRCIAAVRADPELHAQPILLSIPTEQLLELRTAGDFDDFVLQPHGWREVCARLRVAEQRRRAAALPLPLEPDGLVIDPVAREATCYGRTVRMTARELALLSCLRARRGSVLSREDLLSWVWGRSYLGGERTVDTHINRLRLKFGQALPIETVRAKGYRLLPVRLAGPGAEGRVPA